MKLNQLGFSKLMVIIFLKEDLGVLGGPFLLGIFSTIF